MGPAPDRAHLGLRSWGYILRNEESRLCLCCCCRVVRGMRRHFDIDDRHFRRPATCHHDHDHDRHHHDSCGAHKPPVGRKARHLRPEGCRYELWREGAPRAMHSYMGVRGHRQGHLELPRRRVCADTSVPSRERQMGQHRDMPTVAASDPVRNELLHPQCWCRHVGATST